MLSFGEIFFSAGFCRSIIGKNANFKSICEQGTLLIFRPLGTQHTVQMWSRQQKHKILVSGCCSFKWSTSTFPVSTEKYFELGRLIGSWHHGFYFFFFKWTFLLKIEKKCANIIFGLWQKWKFDDPDQMNVFFLHPNIKCNIFHAVKSSFNN